MAEQPQTDIMTFQGLILALQQYWAEQGCVIVQPLDMEVGAGDTVLPTDTPGNTGV